MNQQHQMEQGQKTLLRFLKSNVTVNMELLWNKPFSNSGQVVRVKMKSEQYKTTCTNCLHSSSDADRGFDLSLPNSLIKVSLSIEVQHWLCQRHKTPACHSTKTIQWKIKQVTKIHSTSFRGLWHHSNVRAHLHTSLGWCLGRRDQKWRCNGKHWWCCVAGSERRTPRCELSPGCTCPVCNTPGPHIETRCCWNSQWLTLQQPHLKIILHQWKCYDNNIHVESSLVCSFPSTGTRAVVTCDESSSNEPISTGFWKRMSSTATSLGRHPLQHINTRTTVFS